MEDTTKYPIKYNDSFEIVSRISSTYKNETEGGNPSSVNMFRRVTDLRTFYEDYLKYIEFCEWLKEKAERQ